MQLAVYSVADQPDVEANVAGKWHYGELRRRIRHDNRTWWAQIGWSRAPGENMIGTFPADAVMPADAPAPSFPTPPVASAP